MPHNCETCSGSSVFSFSHLRNSLS